MMRRGKIQFLAWAIVLVAILLPLGVMGQTNENEKVCLIKVGSTSLKTDDGLNFVANYDLGWGVYRFEEGKWSLLSANDLSDYQFQLFVSDARNRGWVALNQPGNATTYQSASDERFVKPVYFKVDAVDGEGRSLVSEKASPDVEQPRSQYGAGAQISDADVLWWTAFPWYMDLIVHLDRIPEQFDISRKTGYIGMAYQAKKAIDNSGMIGRTSVWAISMLGFIGGIIVLATVWFTFFTKVFPVSGPANVLLFFLNDVPGVWRILPGLTPPGDSAGSHVGFSRKYIDIMNDWREIISGVNTEIRERVKKVGGRTDLEREYLDIWAHPLNHEFDDASQHGDDPFVKTGKSGHELMQSLVTRFEKLQPVDKATTRILHAGIKNMENNSMAWDTTSEEVDRAMNTRASQEINELRRKTGIELLYNFAAVTPLLGLLGTVTGISQAFLDLGIASRNGGMDPSEVIGILGPRINEALWTTIFGLMASIVLLLFYFGLDQIFEKIMNKWEELFVHITEDL